MSSAQDVLDSIKNDCGPELLVPLLEDKELQILLAIWQRFPVYFTHDGSEPPEDRFQQWEWLWGQSKYNEDDLQSSVGTLNIKPLMVRAKAAYLIYPDGTINDFALQFLKSKVIAALPKVDKRK